MKNVKTAAEVLEILRALGETNRIEAKSGGSIGRDIMETVCAFSNEPGLDGGIILLGVNEQRERLIPTYPVIGVEKVDKISNDLLTQCRTMLSVPITVRIEPETIEGKVVLVVHVPEASSGSKPVYFNDLGLQNGAFRRGSSGDVRCSDDDLQVLYADRGTESFDSGLATRAEWDDIDPDAVEDYRNERRKTAPDAPEISFTDEKLLYSLSCVQKHDGAYLPTVAGILLFGKKLALRRLFPLMRVDYIRVPGREWVPDPANRFDTLDMRDPLMRVVGRAMTAVLEDFSQPFHLPVGAVQRQVVEPLPIEALREAIVNAVMHRSYRDQSPIQIIRYSNRLEIRNAGYSLKNEETWNEPRSENRNPKIAATLHETRFAETKGSGMRVMRDAMEKVGLSPPYFESDRSKNSFVTIFMLYHFLSEADWQWLGGFREFDLSDEEARALIWVRESGDLKGAINNAVYRNLNSVDAIEASVHLRRLRDVGILEVKGRGSQAYFVPGPIFVGVHEKWQASLTAPVNPIQNGAIEPSSAPPNTLMTEANDASLPSLTSVIAPLVDLSDASARDTLLAEFGPELQQELENLAGRADARLIRILILKLCALRPYRAKELALLMQRDGDSMQRRYLALLVQEGRLELTYPKSVSHPHQAYRTKISE